MSQGQSGKRRCRVLFFGEAATLAHTVRPLELAASLDRGAHEVYFACDPRHHRLVRQARLERPALSLHCVPPETFMERVYQTRPLYTRQEVEACVWDDLQLIDRVQPDVVVGDFRLSLSISAELAGVPRITLANVHWSRAAGRALPCPVPEHPVVRALGVWGARQLMRVSLPLLFKVQVLGFNQIRRRRGLTPLSTAQELFTGGDRTLYLDAPGLFDFVDELSPTERVVGPVCWEPKVPLPPWWHDLPDDRKIVFLTCGSSGDPRATVRVAEAVVAMGAAAMVATAGRIDPGELPEGALSCELLPGMAAAERADLVICNGGAMVYQPLSRGTPVLGIPLNVDQHYLMEAVQRRGAGLLVRAGQATTKAVATAVERLLEEPSFGQVAAELARDIERLDPVAALEASVRELTGARQEAGRRRDQGRRRGAVSEASELSGVSN